MSRPIAPRPYPFDPVQDYMDEHGISDSELGIWTGSLNVRAARRKVQRWKIAGMTEAQADQVAARLHHHISEIWAHYWWTLVPEAQIEDGDTSDSEGASDVQGD